MSKVSISTREWAQAGFKDFVNEDLISAPNTTIQNRAQVSASLRPSFGIERIMFRTINQLQGEYGPNGEVMWELSSKDYRVRFGGTWSIVSNTNNTQVVPGASGDFMEISFYGTGLNTLEVPQSSGGWTDYTLVLDGVSQANLTNPASSTVLNGQGYAQNRVRNVVSNLSLGWHTVKIAVGSGLGGFYGIEIVGPSSLTFPAGSAFSGTSKESLLAAATSSITSSVTGSRGGRIVKYLKDGAIAEAFQATNASQGNLSGADHGNEEVVRKIGAREFGVNQSTDFQGSTGSGSNYFTLDDGTTSLVMNANAVVGNYNGNRDGLILQTNGNFWTITFVGTGLDMVYHTGSSTTADNGMQFFVDGVSIGTFNFAQNVQPTLMRLVSGLPYGTHTLKFLRNNAASQTISVTDFVVYQPKKPAIPAGAIELCDYNVMATYSGANATGTAVTDHAQVPTGVLSKANVREMKYVGTWSVLLTNNAIYGQSAKQIYTGTNGDYLEYVFFGTGIVLHTARNTATNMDVTITIDGVANASGVPVNAGYTNQGAGVYRQVQDASGDTPARLAFTGLTLGLHTIRITMTSLGGFNWQFVNLDVITPIHSHDKGFFKIGSLALNDSRNKMPVPLNPNQGVDLSKAKAWCIFKTNSGVPQILASFNVSALVRTTTGQFILYFARPFKNESYIALGGGNYSQTFTNAQQKPSHYPFTTTNTSGTVQDPDGAGVVENVIFFGELENEENQ